MKGAPTATSQVPPSPLYLLPCLRASSMYHMYDAIAGLKLVDQKISDDDIFENLGKVFLKFNLLNWLYPKLNKNTCDCIWTNISLIDWVGLQANLKENFVHTTSNISIVQDYLRVSGQVLAFLMFLVYFFLQCDEQNCQSCETWILSRFLTHQWFLLSLLHNVYEKNKPKVIGLQV